MNTTLKTLIFAAAGAALIAASPVSAQTTYKRAGAYGDPAPATQRVDRNLWQYGEINANPGVDSFGQIRNEYLKDAPTHNGNSY